MERLATLVHVSVFTKISKARVTPDRYKAMLSGFRTADHKEHGLNNQFATYSMDSPIGLTPLQYAWANG